MARLSGKLEPRPTNLTNTSGPGSEPIVIEPNPRNLAHHRRATGQTRAGYSVAAMAVASSSPHRLLLLLLKPPNPLSSLPSFSSSSLAARFPFLRLLPPRPCSCMFMAAPAADFAAVSSAVAAAPVPVKERIELSETERRIFTRLLDVVRHFELDTRLRVAGGWVRDKVSLLSFFPIFLCLLSCSFPICCLFISCARV